MSLLRLELIGDFKLLDANGQPVEISARKGRALLAIVALSPSGSVSRQRLANLLWGDRADEQARGSLRQTLSSLRRDLAAIDAHLLSSDDENVAIDLKRISSDIADFRRLALSDDLADLRTAMRLWRGDPLANIAVHASELQEWIGEQRSQLHAAYVEVLERLWELESQPNRVMVAKELVAREPLKEAAHRMLMQAYAEAGENGLALQHYAACRELLKRELGIVPGVQIEELRQKIREGAVSAPFKHLKVRPKRHE